MIYLFIKNKKVEFFADKEEAEKFGYKNPDKEISDEEFEKNRGIVRLENGKIVLGPPKEELLKEAQQEVREKRNNLLKTVVDPMQYILRWNDLTKEKQVEWEKYRRDLLDITDDPNFKKDPSKIIFPKEPENK